ncbi:cytochrome b5 [Teratosphaeria nubilosa]|uniref:Cytochrome b5 n=1 Tax=Teratosphaeria nubilosa TaxID=161662 RepID=A0A6G1KUG1_9PEZI|nr:cytochrome b5 [Teratosphaeria nubilosa]
MAETKTYTYSDVSEHTTKKDVWMVIHDKVYDASSFVDEHPGGEEVLLDVGGQDATEAFEDVGHSDEAREILHGLLKGDLERKEGDPAPKISTSTSAPSKVGSSDAAGLGIGVYALILAGGALAFFAYQYLQSSSQKQS